MNYNEVKIAGRLTRDPELRYTPKGSAVAKISIAINRKWKGEDGQMKEDVTFVDVDAFGRTAENIGQYFKKGSQIWIDGRLKLDTWDDKQTGKKRSRLGVIADRFQFVDGEKSDQATGKPKIASIDVPGAAAKPEASAEPPADDMPF
jgi:single-strand DNA-binding protein